MSNLYSLSPDVRVMLRANLVMLSCPWQYYRPLMMISKLFRENKYLFLACDMVGVTGIRALSWKLYRRDYCFFLGITIFTSCKKYEESEIQRSQRITGRVFEWVKTFRPWIVNFESASVRVQPGVETESEVSCLENVQRVGGSGIRARLNIKHSHQKITFWNLCNFAFLWNNSLSKYIMTREETWVLRVLNCITI